MTAGGSDGGEIELDGDFAGFEFGFEQAQGFVEQRVDVLPFAARARSAARRGGIA